MVDTLISIFTFLFSLLPNSFIQTIIEEVFPQYEFLAENVFTYVAWFLPFDVLSIIFDIWVGAVGLIYIYYLLKGKLS